MKTLFLVFVFFILSTFLSATIINIPEDFDSIQEGLNFASEGDTILVAEGIYVENLTWPETNSLKLVGSNENNCIIDGDSLFSVIHFGQELNGIIDLTTLIKDFTIQNGYYGYGGGIYCDNSSPSLQNLILTNNYAVDYGGGVACFNSNPNLVNLLIINNLAYYGGGIYCNYSNPSIYDVQINNNSAQAGAGMFCENSSPNIENVTISSNSANSGGGIYCCYSSNPNLENVLISDNLSNKGAGICCQNSDPSLVNVILTGNSASRGGGIFCESNSNPNLENVTINNNTAYYGGGIFCWINSYPIFSSENRCNIYSNIYTNSRGAGMDIFIYESQLPVIDVFVDTFTVMRPTDYYASPIDNFTFDILHSIEDSLINADVYVSVEGDNSNNGTSPETPFKTIKYALSRIYSDIITTNTIHLATGIYSPTTNGESFPIKWSNYVNLSGSGEEETILDAENSGGVMEFISVSDALIENLTITSGSAHDGGGIYCRDHSNPSFENVVIINNSAVYDGGGIYCNDYSNPSLDNVELSGNYSNSGGGIFCNGNSNPSLENVTIADNTAEYHGGGILCRYSSPSLENVTITGNSANGNYYGGGGIYCSQGSSPSLENVTISDNSAIYGGGIFCCVNSNPSLVNVTITGNSANAGGGIYCNDSSPSLINVTISSNTAIYSNGGGILCDDNSNPSLTNCIMWNDSPEEIYIESGSVTATYSDIQGGWAGTGNINEDPLFADPQNGDFHLTWMNFPIPDSTMSPCIDTGDPSSPLDPDGTIADMGAYYYDQGTGTENYEFQISNFRLNNYPNPFNPTTTISFNISRKGAKDAETCPTCRIVIYNIKGQKVKSFPNLQINTSPNQQIVWDGKDEKGQNVSSGVYFYRLKVNDKIVDTKKCLLLK